MHQSATLLPRIKARRCRQSQPGFVDMLTHNHEYKVKGETIMWTVRLFNRLQVYSQVLPRQGPSPYFLKGGSEGSEGKRNLSSTLLTRIALLQCRIHSSWPPSSSMRSVQSCFRSPRKSPLLRAICSTLRAGLAPLACHRFAMRSVVCRAALQ